MFSKQGDKDKERGNRQNNSLPKSATRADGRMKTLRSLRLKYLHSTRPTETTRESPSSTPEDKRRDSIFVKTDISPALSSKQATLSKSPEAKVYRSFTEEKGTNQVGGGIRTLKPEQTSTENAKTSFTKRSTETVHTSPIIQPADAVKRYALLRGMLSQSRFEKDHDVKKDRNEGKIIQDKAQRRPSRLTSDTVQLDKKEYKQWINRVSFCDSKTVNDSWKTTNVGSRSDDKYVITGTRFPKRIYIREVSNGAIVDEIVDVQSERDWEVLNYMSPLRHISCDPQERSKSLNFQDLKNFDVYYYPHPWR